MEYKLSEAMINANEILVGKVARAVRSPSHLSSNAVPRRFVRSLTIVGSVNVARERAVAYGVY